MLKQPIIRLILLSFLASATVNCAKKQMATTYDQNNKTASATSTTSEAADYQPYVGKYKIQLDGIESAEVTIENNRLYGKTEGRPKTELIRESKDKFRVEGMDATVTFTRNGQQQVTGLVLVVDGNEIKGEKVD